VAGVIAANFNGQGTVGVAYNSTILSVRADTTGTCSGQTCISSTLAATGIDYAIAQGAKVVNLSFGETTGTLGSTFEAALLRGVSAGLIFAVSAGNDSAANPAWPAMYAADPRFAGSIIAVGATNPNGTLASFSNQAGSAQNVYMTAPGVNIITDCAAGSCVSVSGTSFSAPQVAGAMALMLQAFPNLTGKQVVSILLQTADSQGTGGINAVYGVGALDIARAFQPVGTLSVAAANGGTTGVTTVPGASVSSAVGDAIARTQALTTVGRDVYQRMFKVNLAQGYRPAGVSLLALDPAIRLDSSDLTFQGVAQGRLQIAASRETGRLDPADHFHWMVPGQPGGDVSVSYERAGFSVSAWTGGEGTSPFSAQTPDAFIAAAQPDHAVRAALSHAGWRLMAEAGAGQRLSPEHTQFERGASYVRFAVGRGFGPVDLSVGGGELVEPQGPLGSYLPQRSGLELPARTGFMSGTVRWGLAPGLDFNGQVDLGRTALAGAFLQTAAPAWSSAWRMSLDADCRSLDLACSTVHLSLSQPLRIEQGQFVAVLPDAPQDPGDPLTFSTRRFAANPSGREVDLRLQADRDLGRHGVISLQAAAASQPGNIQAAPLALGAAMGWRIGF
jgi:hypothetical protein